MRCSVLLCKLRYHQNKVNNASNNIHTKGPKVSFHTFPKNEELKNEWLRRIGRPSWKPHKNSVICSNHFTSDCYTFPEHKHYLKQGSLPTLDLPADDKDLQIMGYVTSNVTSLVPNEENMFRPKLIKIENCDCKDNADLAAEFALTASSYEQEITFLKSKLEALKEKREEQARKIDALNKRNRRLETKNYDLFERLSDQFNKEEASKEQTKQSVTIEKISNNDLIKRLFLKKTNSSLPKAYSPELKEFAVKLLKISPQAYRFIREEFEYILPHEKTVLLWNRDLNSSPGIVAESSSHDQEAITYNSPSPSPSLQAMIDIDTIGMELTEEQELS